MKVADGAEGIRDFLRAQTREDHDRVDAAAGRFDLAQSAGQAAFLQFMYRGLQPVEDGLTQAGAERLYETWPRRQRATMLRRDLARLDADHPPDRAALSFRTDEQIWGALYVLEGSRLGAALLQRQWSGTQLPEFFGHDTVSVWPAFLDRIRRAVPAHAAFTDVLDGARRSYCSFFP